MKAGTPVMYYLEGWRYGIIRRIPIKGERKGMMQIEVPVDRWKFEAGKWMPRARDKSWVPARNVRELDAAERERHNHSPLTESK